MGRRCTISGRHWVLSILVLVFGCLTVYAPSAGAKPKPPAAPGQALPFRGCQGLLTLGDFSGAVAEESPPGRISNNVEVSVCEFRMFTMEHAAAYVLECAVEPDIPMCTHRGGNDGLVVAGAALYKKHPQVERRPSWPAGFTRHIIHGVGTSAELGYSDSVPTFDPMGHGQPVGFGWLQVRNDVFDVEAEGAILPLLERVASELCNKCK